MSSTPIPPQSTTPLPVQILNLFFKEWQVIWEIGQRVFAYLNRDAPVGLFEVLDYDSTLELLDAKGKTAVFRRRQKVRFLQDHILAFQDYAWGDGEVLADYKITPGVEVDRYREGNRWNLLISLRETKSKGEIEEFHIERTVKNGFVEDMEWRQTEIWLTTRKIRLGVIFPKSRPCKRAQLLQRGKNRTLTLDHRYIRHLPDGRQVVAWEKYYPKRAEIYTLRWEW